nr:copia protein [Tanacetum cinerariifolium]
TSDPLALIAEKTKVSKSKEKVVVSSDTEGSESAYKKQEFVKSDDKKVDEKKRDMSKVKCYNRKKEGHFAKDCKKAKIQDYNYYKTKMLLAKKDSDKQVLSESDESSSSAEETIAEVAYYTSESESESEFEILEYYDNSTNYGLFVNNDDDQEIFHDAIESASEKFNENHIDSQKDYDKSEVDHNDSEEKEHLVDKLIRKFNHKISKYTYHGTSDPLALITEKTKVSKSKERVVVSSDSERSDADYFSELKKITALSAKAFNRRKFYSKPTNNNLRTSSTSQSANKKQEFVKTDNKKVEKKDDEKKQDMSKVKRYNYKKEGHFAKDCKKVKVKDYEYYKTKMLLAKKDKDEQVLLAEDQAWMESSSDSDQEINANMVFMAQIDKVLSNLEASSSSADDKISEVAYYLSELESESEYETLEYYDNITTYGLFVNDNDDQEIFHECENLPENLIESQIDNNESVVDHNNSEGIDKLIRKFNKKIVKCHKHIKKANQQSKDFKNQNKDLQEKYDVLKNQATTFEMNNKELNEQLKVLIEKNDDLLAQTKVLKDQLQVKHVVIDTHVECQENYAKLEAERYEYMIRYSAYFDNDKQHRKQIADLQVLYDKKSVQLVESDKHVRDLKNMVLEKDFKISELEECVHNKDLEIEKCLERLNVCENKLHKIGQTNQTVHMIMPSKDILYNGQKGIDFENPRYTLMFLTHSNEALEIKKFKRARENKIEFAYDYENLNASYVNEKINLSDDYFQEIINPDFDKIDSPFQQTSSLKPYVLTVILEKIIIDLEDEVVNLLEKEKANLKTIESLKSKGFESSENAISESENQSENDCQVVEQECDKMENSKVIAPGMFKLSVSHSVSPILMPKTSCDSKNVETQLKRKRYLDTFSSVRRPKRSDVIWKKKGSSNTSNVDLSSISHLKLNKDVKRYFRKDLLSCNNSHLRETSSAYVCNDAMNVSCNSRLCDLFDENNFFIFDDESVRISPVSKMPFRKKPRDAMNIVQICLWIIDSGCSKHMTGNRALLTNFVEKFLGTIRFGNNDFAMIAGYRDVVIGSMIIKKVYYVEGLGHNLFSIGQFCDRGLEVAFRKSTCFVRNEDGVDLLTGDLPTPMVEQAKLKLDLVGKPVDHTDYRSMIRSLMYVTSSRPDIMFATCDKLVCWSSKKQNCVSISTTKFEYVAVSSCCAQVLWMRTRLTDYGFFYDKVPIYCDSKSAIAISCNPVQHTRTKHIDVRYHFIKDHIEKETIELYFVGTEYQLVDLFTKSLPEARFKFLVKKLGNRADVAIPLDSIREISERFVNLAYGFFLGKRVAYPVVVNYVKNTWSKYGLVTSMLNSSNRLFFFHFSSEDGLDAMLENVWVKFHGVPRTAFSEDGLSVIATKQGTPLMLDSYTFDMCKQSWGRPSYARAMIDLRADEELKDSIMVDMTKLVGEGFNMCTVRVEDE